MPDLRERRLDLGCVDLAELPSDVVGDGERRQASLGVAPVSRDVLRGEGLDELDSSSSSVARSRRISDIRRPPSRLQAWKAATSSDGSIRSFCKREQAEEEVATRHHASA